MEDYTYDLAPRRAEGARRPHARDLPVDRRRRARRARSIRSRSAGKDDPVRLVFTAAPGPAVVVGDARPRRPLPAGRQRGRASSRRTKSCRSCPSRAPSGSRSRTSRPPPRRGSRPAARTTPSSAARSASRPSSDLAEIAGVELLVIDGDDANARLRERAALERGLLPPRPGARVSRSRTPSCASGCSRRTSRSSAPASSTLTFGNVERASTATRA